jgi:hypothetical protein
MIDVRDMGSLKRTVGDAVTETPVAPATGRVLLTVGAAVFGAASIVKRPFPTPYARSSRVTWIPIPLAAGPESVMSAVQLVGEVTVMLFTVIPGLRKPTVIPARKFVPPMVTINRCPTAPRFGVTDVTVGRGSPQISLEKVELSPCALYALTPTYHIVESANVRVAAVDVIVA